MADNFTANAGSGGSTFASDDVGGVQYPRLKHSFGRDAIASDVGTLSAKFVSANTNNLTSVKAGPGTVYAILAQNVNASVVTYLKLYNKASAPVVASDTPVLVMPIPASGGFAIPFPPGIDFSTGIAFALATASGDTSTAAPGAGDVFLALCYV